MFSAENKAKAIVLTRDQSAGVNTKNAILASLPNANIILAPVREIVKVDAPWVDPKCFDALIITSANAFRFCEQDLSGLRVYCVGEWVAQLAEKAGCKVATFTKNVCELVEYLAQMSPMTFLYLRGQNISTKFEACENLGHHEFQNVVCYRADHKNWSSEERLRISQNENAVFPVFSKASAQSLLVNTDAFQSHFCAAILPISNEVGAAFEGNKRFSLHPPPQTPNLVQMLTRLTHIFEMNRN